MSERTVGFEVPADGHGERLDRFLAARLGDRTRSALRRLIVEGRVRVDGQPAGKPGRTLESGSNVELDLPATETDAPRPEAIPLTVVYEDDALIVVDKPSGMVVHPGHGRRDGTLVSALLGRGTSLAPTGAPDRPGIVHRLDRETTGLIVVARTDAAYHALAAAFAERRIKKRYLALVWGRPEPASGRIERAIGRSRATPTAMAVDGLRGRAREALTRYATLEAPRGFALVEARPHTGRTHQIRVHLRSIGHPIVGDDRYGGRMWRGVQDPIRRVALREFGRLALHAAGLEFAHPSDGRPLSFEAPIPDDLLALLETLRAAA